MSTLHTRLHGGSGTDGRFSAERCSAAFSRATDSFIKKLNKGRLSNMSAIRVGDKAIALNGDKKLGEVLGMDPKSVFVKKSDVESEVESAVDGSVDNSDSHELGKIYGDDASWFMVVESKGGLRSKINLEQHAVEEVRRDPGWICEVMKNNRSYHIPIFNDPDVFARIVSEAVEEEWSLPSVELVQETRSLLLAHVNDHIRQQDRLLSHQGLMKSILWKARRVMDGLAETIENEVRVLVELEKVPFCFNDELFEDLANIKEKREEDEDEDEDEDAPDEETENSTVSAPYETMASAMQDALEAYGPIALKRFSDYVCRICMSMLLDFPSLLNAQLAMVSDDDVERLVSVSPEDLTKRNALEDKMQLLQQGLQAIEELY